MGFAFPTSLPLWGLQWHLCKIYGMFEMTDLNKRICFEYQKNRGCCQGREPYFRMEINFKINPSYLKYLIWAYHNSSLKHWEKKDFNSSGYGKSWKHLRFNITSKWPSSSRARELHKARREFSQWIKTDLSCRECTVAIKIITVNKFSCNFWTTLLFP